MLRAQKVPRASVLSVWLDRDFWRSDPFPRTWPVSRRTQSDGPRVVLALKFSVARVLVS